MIKAYLTGHHLEVQTENTFHQSTTNIFSRFRPASGLLLTETEDFTATEVKEIASRTMKTYNRLCIINYIKYPKKTLKMALNQPNLVGKFIKNL